MIFSLFLSFFSRNFGGRRNHRNWFTGKMNFASGDGDTRESTHCTDVPFEYIDRRSAARRKEKTPGTSSFAQEIILWNGQG